MPLSVVLVDKNMQGIKGVVDSLSLCRDNTCTYRTVQNVMQARPQPHLSALENLWYKFLVSGLSVKARIQLERHRILSSMERSTRAIDMSEAEFVVPPNTTCPELFTGWSYPMIRDMYNQILNTERNNGNEKYAEEIASYILPMGVTTQFTLAGNGRALFEYLNKRLCYQYVLREHYQLALEIFLILISEDPIFKLASPCKSCGACNNNKGEKLNGEK